MMVGQKSRVLKPELLDNQQITINKPSYGFDLFFPNVSGNCISRFSLWGQGQEYAENDEKTHPNIIL